MSLVPGATLGAYRIIEPLGRGGMASVFRAYEAGLDRYVALKVLPGEFMHDDSFAERFRREARMLAGLEHPCIIPIHAYGIDNGIPWMAMRLVAGGTLAALSHKGRLPHDRILTVLEGVAEALDYAHAKGVIHRDVKPQNVLLDEAGRVYLADFGIAKMVEGATIVTQAGVITGTPQYMSPEQVSGDPLDGRCDVYALGIITYELLTGNVPFSADTPIAVLMKHVSEPIPLQPLADVPEPLMRAVLKAVAKKPADRWATAGAFATAVAGSLSGHLVEPPPPEAPTIALPRQPIAVPPTRALPPPVPRVPLKPPLARPVPAARAEVARGQSAREPERATRQGMSPTVVAGIVGGASAGFALMLLGAWAIFSNKPSPEGTAAPPPTTQEPRPVAPTAEPRPQPSVSTPDPATPAATLPPASSKPTPTAPISTPTPSAPGAREGQSAGQRTAATSAPPPIQPSTPAVTVATTTAPHAAAQAVGSLEISIEAERVTAGRAMPLYVRVVAGEGIQRSTAILFPGGSLANAADEPLRSSYARETVTVEGLPLGATRVSLLVGTDRTLGGAARGSTEISIKPGVNRASAVVRFAGPRDREVRFR